MIDLTLPIKTISEANVRHHWATMRRRKIAQQQEVDAELHKALSGRGVQLPCVVTFTRIGPRKLDDDNLRSSFKGIRDSVARRIGVDDGDERIRFEYQQEPVGKHQYAIRIQIDSPDQPAT